MNIQIDTVNYLNLTVPPEKVADTLNIEVSSHAYLPKTDDPESDWVASCCRTGIQADMETVWPSCSVFLFHRYRFRTGRAGSHRTARCRPCRFYRSSV